jgi:hypothetical protein
MYVIRSIHQPSGSGLRVSSTDDRRLVPPFTGNLNGSWVDSLDLWGVRDSPYPIRRIGRVLLVHFRVLITCFWVFLLVCVVFVLGVIIQIGKHFVTFILF